MDDEAQGLWERSLIDPESLDPEFGGVRPEGGIPLNGFLPKLQRSGNRHRIFTVEYLELNVPTFGRAPMLAKQARVHLEDWLTELKSVLQKGRVYETVDCWFNFKDKV